MRYRWTERGMGALAARAAVGVASAWAFALAAAPLDAQAAPSASQSLTLGEAVRIAIDRSPRVEAARYQLVEAEERVTEAWSAVYPSLDFSSDYTRNLSPSISFLPAIIFDPTAGPDDQVAVQFGADNLWQSSINVEQTLFDGGVFIGLGAAARYQQLSEEVLRGETQSVVTRVRNAFYQALLAQEEFRLTGNSVARVREALTETQALYRAGLASEYDALRLEVELANLEPNLLRAENTVRQARRNLALELDIDAGAIQLEGSLATLMLDDVGGNSAANREILAWSGPGVDGAVPPDQLVDRALVNRSDLRQLGVTEELRLAELRAQQAEFLPRVSLFGNYGVTASQSGAPRFFGEPRAYARRVGVRVTVPIFQGFARTSRVDQRRAGLRTAQINTAFARSAAENEVRTLIDQLEEARLRAAAQARAVQQATRGFEISRAQFREGLGSRLDLTDAEVALRQSEFNYARAVHDFLVSSSRLDEATGAVPIAAGGVTP